MKKTLLLIIAIISSGIFIFQSCRQDGNLDENLINSQFSFEIERDKDFKNRAVGETTDIKFNVKTKYDFATVPMVIKYTGDLNGVLRLGDLVLEHNKEYNLKNAVNILKYTGNEAGIHKIKISVKNSKDQSCTEEFEFKYDVTDFKVDINVGNGEYYQGQEITYIGKITPIKNTENNVYFIKFNVFDGFIKYNGVQIELGKEYAINDINKFTISTVTSKSIQQKLIYTIKNSTVSRDFELQVNVKNCQVIIESLDLQPRIIKPNTEISLVGVVKKSPIKVKNSIKYKTWITSATNNNIGGIVTTNNNFVDYVLSPNGDFNTKMLAKDPGSYTVNFQAQDEYGNLSEVKQFEVKIAEPFSIATTPSVHFNVYKPNSKSHFVAQVGLDNLNITTNIGNTITKVELNIEFRAKGENIFYNKTLTYEPNATEIKNQYKWNFAFKDGAHYVGTKDWNGFDQSNGLMIIYDNQGNKFHLDKLKVKGDWFADYRDAIQ